MLTQVICIDAAFRSYQLTIGYVFGLRWLRGVALPRINGGIVPKFFFHIRGPDAFIEDDVGVELRDIDHVKAEAQQGARDIVAADLRAGRMIDHQSFEICDERGEIVLVLAFRDMVLLKP